ncbi:MAG: flippase-like domain-containing protein [bacterium]|nr:flippase-like domain-containing protein [bacterium]
MTTPEMPTMGQPKRSKWFLARHLWIVGLVVYLTVIWIVGVRRIGSTLTSVNVRLLGAVFVLEIAGLWIRALKWRYALGPRSRAVGLFFLSRCAGYWMPMRVGELSPLLIKEHRTPKMGAWIVVDRVLEISTTLFLGCIGVIALQISNRAIIVAMVLTGCVFVVVPVYLLTRRSLFLWLAERCREGSLLQRVSLFLAAICHEVIALRWRIPLAAAITVAAGCMDVIVSICLWWSFGYLLPFALLATAKCVHAVTCAVPFTPNATGVPFVTAGLLLHEVGGVPTAVITAAVGVYIALVSVVFWSVAGLIGAAFGLRVEEDSPEP